MNSMNAKMCAYFGNPWIGMFIKTNDERTFVPLDTQEKVIAKIAENLKTEINKLSVGDSNILGIYIAMNSTGAIVPNVANETEISILKKSGLNVYQCKDKNNAYGNNILVNDKGAVINEHINKSEIKNISDTLGVECFSSRVAEYQTVGSACIANNSGFLAHFAAKEDDMQKLQEYLKVPGAKGSVNMGVGFISYGLVANNNNYVSGQNSSAFELGRVEQALGYLK